MLEPDDELARTRNFHPTGHTRLPRYAPARTVAIDAWQCRAPLTRSRPCPTNKPSDRPGDLSARRQLDTGQRCMQKESGQLSDSDRVADDRERLTTTFDSTAGLYQQARPEYPDQLYDVLVQAVGIKPGDRLLEVGCATGKVTIPLARRGFRITCVEIGSDLTSAARRNLAEFQSVEIIESAFETWQPRINDRFDLVFAATAWHWLDPTLRYQRVWDLLRPRGYLAFWSATHVFPDGGDPFFVQIQDVYDEIGESLPKDVRWPRPGQLPDSRDEIEQSGLFEDVFIRQFGWEISYTADEYIQLLDTFSGHIAVKAWQRDRLYTEIRRRLGRRSDDRLRRHWGAVLHVARRADLQS